jgi:hypothetical protein
MMMNNGTAADRLRKQAAEFVRLAAELDRAAPMPAPGRDRYFLDTSRAMALRERPPVWFWLAAAKRRVGVFRTEIAEFPGRAHIGRNRRK